MPQFAYVLSLASTESLVTSSVNLDKETCAPTGTTKAVQGLILAAVANLKTDLLIASTLTLDDYQTDLNFIQRNVPTELDESVLYLTGLLGKTSAWLALLSLERRLTFLLSQSCRISSTPQSWLSKEDPSRT